MEPVVVRLLPATRYLVALAVAGSFLSAAALFAYGLLAVFRIIWVTVSTDLANLGDTAHDVTIVAERLAVNLIQLTDVFLLGTIIYLVGLGLHLVFINPNLPAQPWVAVEDLDSLKALLVRVIVVLVGVTFLGSFVEHADDVPVLELSIATALVVAAFTLVIFVAKLPDRSSKEAEQRARSPE
jgi:uncharacterized membrane protein YqhA